jgi:osmotically-inducible protein OsmY
MPQATIPGEVNMAVRQRIRRTSPHWATDSQVVNSAAQRFQASLYPALRSISCEFHEGVLVLRGRVRTYFLKQMAQETVRTVDGVGLIVNVVEVKEP